MKGAVLAILITLAILAANTDAQKGKGNRARKLIKASNEAKKIKKQFIVQLDPNSTKKQVRQHLKRTRALFKKDNDDNAGADTLLVDGSSTCKIKRRSKLIDIGNFIGYTVACLDEEDLDPIFDDEIVLSVEENMEVNLVMATPPLDDEEETTTKRPRRNKKAKGKSKGKGKTTTGPSGDDKDDADEEDTTNKPRRNKKAKGKGKGKTTTGPSGDDADEEDTTNKPKKNKNTKGKGKGKGKDINKTTPSIDESGEGSEEDDVEEVEFVILNPDGTLVNTTRRRPCRERPRCACRRFGLCGTTTTAPTTFTTSDGNLCTCVPTTATIPMTSGSTGSSFSTSSPSTISPITTGPTTTSGGTTPTCGSDIVNCAPRSVRSWGLDRLDDTDDNILTSHGLGQGVDAYIVDTGVNIQHTEFCGRVEPGRNFVDGTSFSANDDNGHGTHVAGTVGGKTVGVARDVTIIPVKVLSAGGSGSTSGIVNGLNWIVEQYRSRGRKAVINMSLGCTCNSVTMNNALDAAIAEGIVGVVAAGNSNRDACDASPARLPAAITVASSTNSDSRSSFSNYGSCVDIYAPGSSIFSAWAFDVNAYRTISGTSMASPHVAGVAAAYLSTISGNPSPATVMTWLTNNSLQNKVTNNPSGNNDLLQGVRC